jgi:uncharacterized protein (DUF2147 family)
MYLADIAGFLWRSGCMIATVTLLAGGAAAQGTARAPAPDVSGVWIDHTGQGAVEIGPCVTPDGNASSSNRVCGRVVWLKNPEHRSVSGKLICGAQVLGDLRRDTSTAWESGWIYNPEGEERFSASLQLANADTLMVTGYLGIKFLGETFTWKRATTNLERCAASTSTH